MTCRANGGWWLSKRVQAMVLTAASTVERVVGSRVVAAVVGVDTEPLSQDDGLKNRSKTGETFHQFSVNQPVKFEIFKKLK
jgi:hypothetical protein